MISIPTVRKMKLAELDDAAYNPRAIDADALQGLQDSLTKFGMLDMVVVNVHDGKRVIVSGHQRRKAMMNDGVVHADVIVVDFDDVTEKMANVAMNNPHIQGSWDPAKGLPQIKAVMPSLPRPDFAGFERLQAELKKEAERAQRLAKNVKPTAGPATDKTEKPKSVLGTAYPLGRHTLFAGAWDAGMQRIACADATITTLPVAESGEHIAGSSEEFIAAILGKTKGSCFLIHHPAQVWMVEQGWSKAKGILHRWLVWSRPKGVAVKADYHSQYLMVAYGYQMGAKVEVPVVPRANVLELPADPVELVKALMEDSTEEGQVILDPFAGSGAVLVAADALGRSCYACEEDLHHVDAVRKWYAEKEHGAGCNWCKLTQPLRKG